MKSKAKCPRCQGTELSILELWRDHSITFEQDEHGNLSEVGEMEPGESYKVEATCYGCGHRWTIRGATSHYDLEP